MTHNLVINDNHQPKSFNSYTDAYNAYMAMELSDDIFKVEVFFRDTMMSRICYFNPESHAINQPFEVK